MLTLIAPAAVACIVMLLIAPYGIPLLHKLKFGQSIREDGPQWHNKKAGTPTMGGIMIFLAIVAALALTCRHWTYDLWMGLAAMAGFGLVGLLDDYIKVVKKRNLGLQAIPKFLLQILVAAALSLYIVEHMGSVIRIPFIEATLDLGWWYFPILILVFLAAVNSVNLTDGLDGLASGVGVVYFAAMALIFYTSEALLDPQMTAFATACAGALIGFLRFNTHPARVIMGDVGALTLGGAVAYLAISGGLILWLPVMAGAYAVSSLSDILQVLSLRLKGRRIFKMAPLHHHLELIGMDETRIVAMYILASVMLCMLGLMAIVF